MLRLAIPLVALLLFLAAPTCRAEVYGSDKHGFEIRIVQPVNAPADAVYRQFLNIEQWWSADHTYSGDAKNLRLEAKPHGWFVERLPDGGFAKHMEVAFLKPPRTIRLLGGLGPLQGVGLNGAMTVTFADPPDASDEETTESESSGDDDRKPKPTSSVVQLRYVVSGYARDGVDVWAGPVDQVLRLQMARLAERAAETNRAETNRPRPAKEQERKKNEQDGDEQAQSAQGRSAQGQSARVQSARVQSARVQSSQVPSIAVRGASGVRK